MDSDILIMNRKGMFIIELTMALAVMAVLVFALVRLASGVIVFSQDQRACIDLQAIAQACRNYQAQHGQWPASMNDLITGFLSPTISNLLSYHLTINGQLLKISNTLGQSITAQPYIGMLSRLQATTP